MKTILTGIVVIFGFMLALAPFVSALNDAGKIVSDIAKATNEDIKNNNGKGCLGCFVATVLFIIIAFIVGLCCK